MERILSYEDIRFFRLIAEAALEKQKLVKEVKKATKTSWFPFGRKKNAEEAAAAAANVENLLDGTCVCALCVCVPCVCVCVCVCVHARIQ